MVEVSKSDFQVEIDTLLNYLKDTDNNFRREAVRAADVSPQLQFLSTFKSVENIFVESSTERKIN